ncbi:enoyl-CoA hydratase/carnithine racemase [Umbelopsis sp. PMI_123]|nr:enoyl-CoA hydratase/carnithine racemase [Umbelopsis sp. PMI_123]
MSVRIEKPDKHIVVITIDRPEVRNAVDKKTARLLADAFRDFDKDPELRVAILTGAGGRFCAGADLKAIFASANVTKSAADATSNALDPDMTKDGPMGPTRMFLSKPVIAAVSGHAVAGGMELALWADLRVVDDSSVFGIFCRTKGVPLIDGGTIRLPRLIGYSAAMDLILTGRPVYPDEAIKLNLANYRAPKYTTALEEAIKLAKLLASHPQVCMRNDREAMLDRSAEMQALKREFEQGIKTLQSGEFRSAVGRFLGKL